MKPHHLTALLLCSAALAACAQTAPATTPPEPESARLGRELRALAGEARCSADTDCRALPVGAKACGGPAGYLAWSGSAADGERLAALARRQAEAQRREIEASGLRSDCRITPEPAAVCQAGRCQIAPAGAPASAR
jgi:hypothetical protein